MRRPTLRHTGMNEDQTTATEELQITVLDVAGMSCDACAGHVNRAIDGMIGVIHVEVDLQRNRAVVEHLSKWIDATALIRATRGAGYEARVAAPDVPNRPKPSRSCCGGRQTRGGL